MKYRKKPVVIEAQQFTDELKYRVYLWAQSIQMNVYHSLDDAGKPILKIPTLEGEMTCSLGDWIIRGVKGELYPCKPDIFEKTYEPVADETPAVITAADLAKAREDGRREAEAKFWPIFMWLLGYTDFPERKPGEGAYHWRGKLRRDLENTITDFAALLAEKEEK